MAEMAHVDHLAAHMREADRQEVWDFAMLTPGNALVQSLAISDLAATGMIDGVPVCMFGVARAGLLSSVGKPWLLGTDELVKHQMILLRHCKPVLSKMRALFPVMENYVSIDNATSIKWLSWLGFEFEEPQPMGPFHKPFVKFRMGGLPHYS